MTKHWSSILLITLAVLLAYVNILGNQFVWDDFEFVYTWDVTKAPLQHLKPLVMGDLPGDYITNYRPLKNVIYALVYQLGGQAPLTYHLVAITTQVIASLLVWLIAWQLTSKPPLALIAGLLFAVHPVHTEAVTWVTASMDTIGNVFGLAALAGFIAWRQSPQSLWRRWSIALWWLAVFTNELAFPVFILMILYDLMFSRLKTTWRSWWRDYWPYGLALAAYGFMRLGVAGISREHFLILNSASVTAMVALVAVAKYLRLLLWPVNLAINHQLLPGITGFYVFDYHFQRLDQLRTPEWIDLPVLLATATMLIMLLGAWVNRSKNKLITYGTTWFLLCLLPVMQIVPTTTIFAERYLYLASAGICLVAGQTGWQVYTWLKSRATPHIAKRLGMLVLASTILVLGWLTYRRNTVWATDLKLWQVAATQSPDSSTALTNLAGAYTRLDQFDQAQPLLVKALEYQPDVFVTRRYLSNVYVEQGKWQQALDQYQYMLRLQPEDPAVLNSMGDAYLALGQVDQAITTFKRTLLTTRDNVYAREMLARLEN